MEQRTPDNHGPSEKSESHSPSHEPYGEKKTIAGIVKKKTLLSKKIIVAVFISFVAVICFFSALVYLALHKSPDLIRTGIEKRLLDNYGIVTSIEALSIRILPVPHLTASEVKFEHHSMVFSADEVHFYADFRKMISGQIHLTSIQVETPELKITSLSEAIDFLTKQGPDSKPFCEAVKLPPFQLNLRNGSLAFPVDGPLASVKGLIPEGKASRFDLNVISKESGLQLKGSFNSVYTGVFSSECVISHDPSGLCFWDLSMSSERMNLNNIRLALTAAIPENTVVKALFDKFIYSGHLKKLTFRFQGRHDEWNDIRRMSARANAVEGRITLPGSSYVLESINGQLQLENGLVKGEKIKAKLGGSFFENGRLLTGTDRMSDRFYLESDIDVHLAELKGILDAYVSNRKVTDVLNRFENLNGRAKTHLTIKDSLTDLKVYADIRNIDAKAFYNGLRQNISVASGLCTITPENISWQNISGRIGPHHVHESTGVLSFDRNLSLNIRSLSGQIESADALKTIKNFSDSENKIENHIKQINGIIDIRKFSLKGSALKPEHIIWNLIADSENLTVLSPSLPFETQATFYNLQAKQGKITIPSAKLSMNNNPFILKGSLEFPKDGPSSGHMEIKGTVDKSFRTFLLEKNWLPHALLPKFPFTLSSFAIDWEGVERNMTGLFVWKDSELGVLKIETDINSNSKRHLIRNISIITAEDRFDINGTVSEQSSRSPVKGRVRGRLKGKALAALFEQGDIIKADIEGNAWIEIPLNGTTPGYLKGPLTVKNVVFQKDDRTTTIDKAIFAGKGTKADVVLYNLTNIKKQSGPGGNINQLSFPDISGSLSFLPDSKALFTVTSGNICGVDFSGELQLPAMDMNLEFNSNQKKPADIQKFLSCFGVEKVHMTGNLFIEGSLSGTPSMIRKGTFKIRATDGVVHKSTVFTKILSLVDLSELFSQNPVKHLLSTGYRYDKIDMEGTVTGDNIYISRAVVDGAGMNLYATGYADLDDRTLDLTVLASPFKAVDRVVYHIPVAGPLISGKNKSLLSVPLVVEGTFDNPRTRFLPEPVSKVSSGILDIFVNAFKLPFVLFYD